MNILVLSFTHIGDATLSTCVIGPLRRAYPGARLTFFAGTAAAMLLDADPQIDAVIPFERSAYSGVMGRVRLVRALRSGRYDLIVDLRDAAYSRLLGGRRIGIRDHGRRHAVVRYLDALNRAGIDTAGARPCLTITTEERRSAKKWLRAHGVSRDSGPLVGVHPGGNWRYKLWRTDRFAAVADALVESHGAQVLVFGGPREGHLRDAVLSSMKRPGVAASNGSLRLLAALIEACDLYVGNDTGPMHIADAVGTRIVALFEPTDDVRSGPFGDVHLVLRSGLDLGCNPCHPGRHPGGCGKESCEALDAIDAATVIRAARRQLDA